MIDTAGMLFVCANVVLRFVLTCQIAGILVQYHDALNRVERGGLGLVGGSSFLTIPVVIDINRSGTPFDLWASCLMSLGCVMFILGRGMRLRKHASANDVMRERAKHYLEGKKR